MAHYADPDAVAHDDEQNIVRKPFQVAAAYSRGIEMMGFWIGFDPFDRVRDFVPEVFGQPFRY